MPRPTLTTRFSQTVASLLLAASCGANAAAGCWIADAPTQASDRSPLGTPSTVPVDRLAREINAILHRNPVLAAMPTGPTPVRLRTRWSVGTRQEAAGNRYL